jgi:hypothetical protein
MPYMCTIVSVSILDKTTSKIRLFLFLYNILNKYKYKLKEIGQYMVKTHMKLNEVDIKRLHVGIQEHVSTSLACFILWKGFSAD